MTKINYNGTPIEYDNGNVKLGTKGRKLAVSRGRFSFANNFTDDNHCIYNNLDDIDGQGKWDGMKINCYQGLRIRTGNSGADQKLEVNINNIKAEVPVEAPSFKGVFKVGNVDGNPSAELAGILRYREEDHGSFFEMCMKNHDGNYTWEKIAEN